MDHDVTCRAMRDAYAQGDHKTARRLANELERALPSGDPGAQEAQKILRETEPDPFIYVLVFLGLGLTCWLVYKYVL